MAKIINNDEISKTHRKLFFGLCLTTKMAAVAKEVHFCLLR